MNNFFPRFSAFAGTDFGAAPAWRRKAPVTDSMRSKLLVKFPWLRDEDKKLKREFDSKDAKGAKAAFRKLARMRDHFRRESRRIAGKHIGERLAAGYLTMGVSELARALFKKPLKAAVKAHIVKLLAKADACDLLLRYWAGKFRVRAAELRKKAAQNEAYKALFLRFVETLNEADKVTADGSTEGQPAQAGDESITEVVEVATESDDVDDPLGFMGLSGNEVMACGALGALAGLAMS